MDFYRKGTIILIRPLFTNVNPITKERNLADYGVVIDSDEFNIYYLPIFNYVKFPLELGKYIKITNEQIAKHTSFDACGYIDLEYIYSTEDKPAIVGVIYDLNRVENIIKRQSEYELHKVAYAPVLKLNK